MEIGPYRLKDNEHLVYNDGAWDEFANVLFVDNPVGTGFSYVDTDSFVSGITQMADQMIQFLEKFFKLFPEYTSNDVGVRSGNVKMVAYALVALHRRRVIRRAAHPLYCQSDTRS